MKVCFWGNQDNGGYRLCKWIRLKNIDAHLYMMQDDSIRSYPEAVDRELEANYPDWIHIYPKTPYKLIRVEKAVRHYIEENFDVVVASGFKGMLSAHNFDVPMICYSTGPSNIGVIKMEQDYQAHSRLKWEIARYLCRKSVRKCQRILTHYDPEIYSLYRLGQNSKQCMFGFPEDVIGNKQRIDRDLKKQLDAKYQKYNKVFLWLSRINFLDKASAEYKGVEKFLYALEKLLSNNSTNIKVIIGEHGYDWEVFKQKVNAKGLIQYFDFVPHLPFWKLLTYLSIENAIVFDELIENNAVSSGMLREALSVNAIICKSYNDTLTSLGHGPNCPVLHAKDTEEVYARMVEVLSWDSARMAKQRTTVEQWSMHYLHWESQINRLIDVLQDVCYTQKVVKRYLKG